MSLFQPSVKAVSAACLEIADSVGASADAQMVGRAGRSLNAALQHFNNRANWNFLLSEAAPVTVFAPFTVTGITASAGEVSAAAPAGHGILPEDYIAAGGFITGLRVSATAASGFGLYAAITSTGSQVVTGTFTRDTYALPSDFNNGYTFRLLNTGTTLRPVGRRFYDRSVSVSEQTVSTPYWYDLFLAGGKGRVRILPPPAGGEVLLTRYYRRMAMSTATGDTAALDIPQDFETYLIAYAKWHFITDKAEGRGDQLKTWYALSQEGLQMMMRDQTRVPDEDLMFIPGAYSYGTIGDNSTRWIDWAYTG